MKKQHGFTLIELVIVVVILGFLAVSAIPKMIDITNNAKQANIEGMAGGFATGISLARSQWEAEGRPSDTSGNNRVSYDGTLVYLTVKDDANNIRPGYMLGLTATAAIGDVDCLDIWNNILQQPPKATDSLTTLNGTEGDIYDYFVDKTTDSTDPVCHYYLKETLSKDASDDFDDPSSSTTIGNSFTYQPANSAVVVYINE